LCSKLLGHRVALVPPASPAVRPGARRCAARARTPARAVRGQRPGPASIRRRASSCAATGTPPCASSSGCWKSDPIPGDACWRSTTSCASGRRPSRRVPPAGCCKRRPRCRPGVGALGALAPFVQRAGACEDRRGAARVRPRPASRCRASTSRSARAWSRTLAPPTRDPRRARAAAAETNNPFLVELGCSSRAARHRARPLLPWSPRFVRRDTFGVDGHLADRTRGGDPATTDWRPQVRQALFALVQAADPATRRRRRWSPNGCRRRARDEQVGCCRCSAGMGPAARAQVHFVAPDRCGAAGRARSGDHAGHDRHGVTRRRGPPRPLCTSADQQLRLRAARSAAAARPRAAGELSEHPEAGSAQDVSHSLSRARRSGLDARRAATAAAARRGRMSLRLAPMWVGTPMSSTRTPAASQPRQARSAASEHRSNVSHCAPARCCRRAPCWCRRRCCRPRREFDHAHAAEAAEPHSVVGAAQGRRDRVPFTAYFDRTTGALKVPVGADAAVRRQQKS